MHCLVPLLAFPSGSAHHGTTVVESYVAAGVGWRLPLCGIGTVCVKDLAHVGDGRHTVAITIEDASGLPVGGRMAVVDVLGDVEWRPIRGAATDAPIPRWTVEIDTTLGTNLLPPRCFPTLGLATFGTVAFLFYR